MKIIVHQKLYLQNQTRYAFNDKNSLIFETRENKEKNLLSTIILFINFKTIV